MTSKSVLRRLAVQLPTCDKCGKPVRKADLKTVELFVARQTHWSPAEYEEQEWCSACREYAEFLSTHPDYEYERAKGLA
jgi:hypothetical protein